MNKRLKKYYDKSKISSTISGVSAKIKICGIAM
jgi:hypothetical protein